MTIQRSIYYIVFIIYHTLVLCEVIDQELHPLPFLDLSWYEWSDNVECDTYILPPSTSDPVFDVIRHGWKFFILVVDR